MGLTNAPIQFQQMLDDVLRPVEKNSDAYIDDILTGTADRGKSGPPVHVSEIGHFSETSESSNAVNLAEKSGIDDLAQHDIDIRKLLDLMLKKKIVCRD